MRLVLRTAVALFAAAVAVVAILPDTASAQDAAENNLLLSNLWIMVAGILVFLMQAGFALVEAGLTRAKNVGNIMMKNLADASVGILLFFIFGYWIAFGEFLPTMDIDTFTALDGGPAGSHATFFFFQAMFAAAAVTIASGAMAGRTKFTSYLLFGVITTGLLYPLVVRITWGGLDIFGFSAADLSVGDAVWSDFAGSTIVHSVGAWAALMGAWTLGPRLGKYDSDGNPRAIPGHNMVFTVIGVFVLWFGWFGFNGGSVLSADAGSVSLVFVTTSLAAAAGAIGAFLVSYLRFKSHDLSMVLNGILGGLVGITAGADQMGPTAAILIGFIAGMIIPFSVIFFDKIKIDDPVGATSVHLVCGIWGTLAVGIFGKMAGMGQLATQLIGTLSICAFTFTFAFGTAFLIKKTIGIRVSEEEEERGLDVSEHGASAYQDMENAAYNFSVK